VEGVFVQAEKHDRVEIGGRIKQIRNAQGLSVQELARRAKVSAGYLSEVERGLPAVSLDKLTQIAGGLAVGLENLLSESAAPNAAATVVQIPTPLSQAAERLNLSHRATLALLQGRRSLMARRSSGEQQEWGVEEWVRFHEQVKDYLPEC
jgi:transcriptional regulator with XRE-family HTH domain